MIYGIIVLSRCSFSEYLRAMHDTRVLNSDLAKVRSICPTYFDKPDEYNEHI